MTKTKAQQIMAATEARAADDVTAAIKDIATEFEPYIIKQRRHFHKHPELSLAEERTTSDIANQLDAMNIPYERPLKTGLVATLRGTAPDAYREDGTPRRRILLRADIDALPVTEQTGEEFASVNEGCMHACGHDCHIAMMLGTLQILRHMTDDIHGEVRIVFQPSEENGQGAKLMIGTGVLDDVDGAYAAHIWSEVDAGTVSCEPGPRMANTDWFRIDVRGTSCHGAMPQRGHDAVMVAAEIVNALQTIVSREISPYEPAVITVGELHGGTARNVIAGTAYLAGTVRTYGDSTHEEMPELMRRIVEHTAAALGAEAEAHRLHHRQLQGRKRRRLERALPSGRGQVPGCSRRRPLPRHAFGRGLLGVPAPRTGRARLCGHAQPPDWRHVRPAFLLLQDRRDRCSSKGSMVAAQYAIDFLAEPTQEELDGPAIAAVAETNPDLAAKLRSAKATAAEARDAMHDARTARHAAIKGIHDARAAARREEKHDE